MTTFRDCLQSRIMNYKIVFCFKSISCNCVLWSIWNIYVSENLLVHWCGMSILIVYTWMFRVFFVLEVFPVNKQNWLYYIILTKLYHKKGILNYLYWNCRNLFHCTLIKYDLFVLKVIQTWNFTIWFICDSNLPWYHVTAKLMN